MVGGQDNLISTVKCLSPEADLGGSVLRGGASDLGKCMKGEVLQKEYLKEYFTGGSTSKGRCFGRSPAGVLQQQPNRTTNDNGRQNHRTDNGTQDDEEEIITLEVGRHHESLDQ